MRNHVITELVKLARTDSRIMLAIADLGFNVVEGFQKEFPDRFINVGIAEQNLTAVAAGLAHEGNEVFTYSIGNFPTLRCIEQIRNMVCYHQANVKILAVGGGFAYGTLGMTHHATEDIAMMRSLPNMRVFVPADAIEAVSCLHEMCKYDGPCYLRMARGHEPNIHSEPDYTVIDIRHLLPIVEGGNKVAILASGTILSGAVKLQQMLTNAGISSSVYSVPSIKPIDEESIRRISQTAKLIITMEEHNIIGGLGGAVAEVVSSLSNHAPLQRFGLQDTFTSEVGNQDYLRDYYGLSAKKIYPSVIKFFEGGK